ncbi:MAG: hypothetical protein KAJ49_06475 [Arcobacteraceae bacterium]|nr:hypothetical protein [Arcobacteraceae bacterium]
MEINSNSQYTYNKATTTTKQTTEKKLENFADYIDKSTMSKNTQSQNKVSAYYEEPTVKWEDQFVYSKGGEHEKTLYQKNLAWAKENDSHQYEWMSHMRGATNGNKYDDAPEFEAFVKKWMDKGESEEEAITRAQKYAQAGLLDYGKQKAVIIYDGLPTEDTKQHGMWLIDNPPLRQAILDTFDSLEQRDVNSLYYAIFHGGIEHQDDDSNFEDLLKQYGIKLEDLRNKNPEAQDEKYTFTGDINLKNDNSSESIEYNNFIFDTLLDYFKDSIESISQAEKENNEDLSDRKNSMNNFIDNFKITIDEYNENNN